MERRDLPLMRKCGFIVHPTIGWLGASPDARVTDPHSDFPDGITEFKCPFSKNEITPREACDDPNFYCYYDRGLHMKKSHHYYHQVQLQLFVGTDQYDWCDFCVYTPKGLKVERIWLDIEWSEKCIKHSGNYSAIVENNPHKMAIFVKTFERNSAKKLWFFEGILKIQTLLQT